MIDRATVRRVMLTSVLAALGTAAAAEVSTPEGGTADLFRFRLLDAWEGSDSIWGDLCVARDGRVYIPVSNHLASGGSAALYRYDPKRDVVEVVADIGRCTGQQPGDESVGQGKIHTRVMEGEDGRIYGGTMMGGHYVGRFTSYEQPLSYAGGHLWVYDPRTDTVEDLGIPVPHEAIYSLWVDTRRGFIYGITFHHRQFFVYHLGSGRVEMKGVVGVGEDLFADAEGRIYTTGPWGNLVRYDPADGRLTDLPVIVPRPADGSPGQLGPNMAHVDAAGIVHSITLKGMVFRYDPGAGRHGKIEAVNHTLGDGTDWVYAPNLTLSRDGRRYLYLAGCHGHYLDGRRPGVHFVEMDARSGKRTDHGLIVTEPQITGCYAAGTAADGTVYFGAQCWGEIEWNGVRRPPGPPVLMIYDGDRRPDR